VAEHGLALGLVISRVVDPSSKLATLTWRAGTMMAADLGVVRASADRIYAAIDWPGYRQDAIEAAPARRHPGPEANRARL